MNYKFILNGRLASNVKADTLYITIPCLSEKNYAHDVVLEMPISKILTFTGQVIDITKIIEKNINELHDELNKQHALLRTLRGGK